MKLKSAYMKLRYLEEFINSKTKTKTWSDLKILEVQSPEELERSLKLIDEQYNLYSQMSGFNSSSTEIESMREKLSKAFPPLKVNK